MLRVLVYKVACAPAVCDVACTPRFSQRALCTHLIPSLEKSTSNIVKIRELGLEVLVATVLNGTLVWLFTVLHLNLAEHVATFNALCNRSLW